MTNQSTVPNIFVNGKHLGGNDVAQRKAADGSLQKLLGS
jgi:glutaredoxin-related protein